MTEPADPRVKEGFLRALELAQGDRARFLETLEREHPAACARVRGLLAAHDAADSAGLDRVPARPEEAHPPHTGGGRLGDYELVVQAGSGAFGSVWRARQLSLDRTVALKVLRANPIADARALERLRAEAEAVARLDHPHIVPVYEVGEHEGHAYFSMKWVEGTLARELERPWPVRDAAELMVSVARAVHHAHQRGLLHRDLKPSNVLLDSGGRPYVADFGIAKRLEPSGQATTTRALVGTPVYMAPEQIEGDELTVATDVWALGCILYELLAGKQAFGGGSLGDTLRRIRRDDPAPLSSFRDDVPRDLQTIVLVALRKEPALRYASADALADDLERWLGHEPIAARRTGAFQRIALFCKRSPLAASLIGLAAGLLVLLAAVSIWASARLGVRLRESYLGEARATRLSGAVGARGAALELLKSAAQIRPGEDLRDEAIACLALTDLTLESSVQRPAGLDERIVPSPALDRIAVGDERGLRILDYRDAAELAVLSPEPDVDYVRWSPGGRFLAVRHIAPPDGRSGVRVRVWDVEARTARFETPLDAFWRSLELFPDERRLAIGTIAGEVSVRDFTTGEIRWRRDAGERTIALCASPDGSKLAALVGGGMNRVQVRDGATGELLRDEPLDAIPYDVCWSDGGRELIVACGDGRLLGFRADAGLPRVVGTGHWAEVVEVFASSSAPLLASYAWDETTRLWDAESARETRRISARVLGFSTDGSRVALSDARTWSVWRVEHGEYTTVLHAHRGKSPRQIHFSSDGLRIASAGDDGVCVADVRSRDHPVQVSELESRGVCFLPGARELAVSGTPGLWRIPLEPGAQPVQVLPGPLWDLALSADGRTLAVQSKDTVHLLDAATLEMQKSLRATEGLEYIAISADGTRIAAGSWRGHGVHVWDLRRSETPRVYLPEQINVSAALSPDGELLAASSSERFELRRTDTGEVLFEEERRRAYGNLPPPVAFSADGAVAVYAASNEIVRMVDVRTRRALAMLEAPQLATVFDLVFSPDSNVLGTAVSANRIELWHLDRIEHKLEELGLR